MEIFLTILLLVYLTGVVYLSAKYFNVTGKLPRSVRLALTWPWRVVQTLLYLIWSK